ncbi:MAG: acyltransferase [Mucilaginibacter sp.]|nr:acyltransferase [Mucilaginibacter sp.]
MINTHVKKFFFEIETIPGVLQTSYFPSLNGIRGIAIIMVVFSHLRLSFATPYTTVFNGSLGVLFFFVLSGFLITTLCLKEKIITHDISLKNFYVRRILRIFPVAYLFILVIIALNFIFKLNISWINIAGTSLYLINFTSYFRKYHHSYYTGHFWSLSVEEQFYLIVPFILKKSFKTFLLAILFIVFIIPVIIGLQYLFISLNNNYLLYAFAHYFIKFQPIAVGCLFAVIAFKYEFKQSALIKVIANLIAFALVFLLRYDDFFSLRDMLVGIVSSFLIAYIIISNLSPGTDLIFKILNNKFLNLVGVLSYSIYIWQEIFTSDDGKLPFYIGTFPFNLIWIIVISALSYYFYESYFLKLKSKFSRIKSAPATSLEA